MPELDFRWMGEPVNFATLIRYLRTSAHNSPHRISFWRTRVRLAVSLRREQLADRRIAA